MPDTHEEYVPASWDETRGLISRAIFRDSRRPELRSMADGLALKIVQALVDAGYWVCRRKRSRTS